MHRKFTVPVVAACAWRAFARPMAGMLLLLLLAVPVHAAQAPSRIAEFLAKVQPAELVPGADHFGPVQGQPPVVAAMAGSRLLGYVFVNADWSNATGYSGRPIEILIGMRPDGTITGARLMDHHEPIVLIGIPLARITHFINGYIGRNALQIAHAGPSARPTVDIVSGATVTVSVIGDSIIRSAISVARAKGLDGSAVAATQQARRSVDPKVNIVEDWHDLTSDGSVSHLALSVGDVTAAFIKAHEADAASHPESASPTDSFVNLYVAMVSVPSVGRSLLGDAGYKQLQQQLKPGQQAIVIAGGGLYSFKGSGYVRGGIFDRIELIQGETSVRFRDRNHQRVGDLAAHGAPSFRDVDIFIVPEGTTIDPAQPWRLQLLAQRAWGGRSKAFLTFEAAYRLRDKYVHVEAPPAPVVTPSSATPVVVLNSDEPPLWQSMWRAHPVQIAILCVALLVLTAIFFFQDWLAKRPLLYTRVRTAYLLFTLVWIGWYADAQLSVVNVLAFLNALRTNFNWDYFLMAPLIFVLWCATAASLLFWNRGAYCGWLCPFGALQELLNRAARKVGIPQLTIPFGVHQRLVTFKYIIFLALFAVSLGGLSTAEKLAEIEPFKTAIVLDFVRAWPFVLYAAALLAANLFVERFFCRYLCPLGAALAIPARLRMFDWLRRYRECGNPCQRCANECPVQAIHPEGNINPNECIQCLNCQVLYHHDQKCPVMITKRAKREKRAAISSPAEAVPGAPGKRPATVVRHIASHDA